MKRYKTKVAIIPVIFVIVGLFSPIQLLSQPVYSFEPTATKLSDNGKTQDPEIFQVGDLIEGNAPMEVLFKANINVPEDYTYHCEWRFSESYEDDFETLSPNGFLRHDDDTNHTFTDAQPWYVKLFVTITDNEGNTTSDDSGVFFTIDISESLLKVPNAFSPNGDGINDVFKVNYKSLVRFNAYVFNRWGQQLYHWGLSTIDEGWDGTHNGKTVKDGVYFIVVEAEGSDGKKYKHKGDINVLKGFSGTGNSSSTE